MILACLNYIYLCGKLFFSGFKSRISEGKTLKKLKKFVAALAMVTIAVSAMGCKMIEKHQKRYRKQFLQQLEMKK